MSRRKNKRAAEALREVMKDTERLDFFETHCTGVGNHLAIVDGRWGCFINTHGACGNSSGHATAREAMDAAIADVQNQLADQREHDNWIKRFNQSLARRS